jgi:cytochrome c oxidase subunit 4
MSAHIVTPKAYFRVWVALMILLLLTWGAAEINLGVLSPVIAIVIAVIKMLLVLLIFMHVRYSSRLTWVFATVGFLWLGIMITLTMSDYLTRGTVRPGNKSMPEWTLDTKRENRQEPAGFNRQK